MGVTLIIFNYDFVITKLFYMGHVIYCFYSVVIIYREYRFFDPTQAINNYKKEIINEISSNNFDMDLVLKNLKRLINYIEDSFSKNELTIANYIRNVYKDLIIHFIKNKDELILNDIDKKEVKELEEFLFSTLAHQTKLSINYGFTNYSEDSFSIIEKILKKCIDCDKSEDFHLFTKFIDNLFSYSVINENNVINFRIIMIYSNIAQYVLKEDKREKWIKNLLEKFNYYSFRSHIYVVDDILKILLQEYFELLEICTKDDNCIVYYNDVLDDINRLILTSITEANHSTLNFIGILTSNHCETLIKQKEDSLLKNYINKLMDIGEHGLKNNISDLFINVIHVYNRIESILEKNDIQNLIQKNKYNLSIQAISYDKSLVIVSFPDYNNQIEENISDISKLRKVVDIYNDIFHRVVISENIDILIYFLDNVKDMLVLFDKDNKKQQKIIISDIYEDILGFCINIKSDEKFHIVLNKFDEAVRKLDKEDKISKSLGEEIINIFSNISSYCIMEKQIEFVISINRYLVKYPEKVLFLSNQKESIINLLFKIGLDSVENNIEELIRNVSNHLGWMGKKAIKNKDHSTLNVILDKIIKLYNICLDFEINKKTVIFIGTSFIVLGGYSTAKNNIPATTIIINGIKKINDKELLNKSKQIRIYASKYWDEIMENNAEENMKDFYHKLSS